MTVTLSLLSSAAFAVRCSRAHSNVQKVLFSVGAAPLADEEQQRLTAVSRGSVSRDAGVIAACFALRDYEAVLAALSGAPSHWRLSVVQVPRPILAAATIAPSGGGAASSSASSAALERCLERVPASLRAALSPHQAEGVAFIVRRRGRALLADDMGLGKTVQAIASLAVYRDEWPAVVLCPSAAVRPDPARPEATAPPRPVLVCAHIPRIDSRASSRPPRCSASIGATSCCAGCRSWRATAAPASTSLCLRRPPPPSTQLARPPPPPAPPTPPSTSTTTMPWKPRPRPPPPGLPRCLRPPACTSSHTTWPCAATQRSEPSRRA